MQAYYLHSVLHDWDDASCLRILQNIVTAMQPSYSKLLINEYIVPDKGATSSITSMNWLMMALGAVRERTEKEWRVSVYSNTSLAFLVIDQYQVLAVETETCPNLPLSKLLHSVVLISACV